MAHSFCHSSNSNRCRDLFHLFFQRCHDTSSEKFTEFFQTGESQFTSKMEAYEAYLRDSVKIHKENINVPLSSYFSKNSKKADSLKANDATSAKQPQTSQTPKNTPIGNQNKNQSQKKKSVNVTKEEMKKRPNHGPVTHFIHHWKT